GGLFRDLLDVHATLARGHERDPLAAAIDHEPDVELLADVGALLDQQAADLLALGTRLVRPELHAQDLARDLADLVDGAGELHATALASPPGVDLGLHDPDLSAERFGGLDRLVDRETGDTPGHRDPVLAQDLLALVLVDIHRRSSKDSGLPPGRRTPRTRWLAAPAT